MTISAVRCWSSCSAGSTRPWRYWTISIRCLPGRACGPPGDPFDPLSVSESVAGMDAVICLYHTPRLPSTDAITGESARRDFYQAVEALLLGLERVGVERLLLIADFPAIERQPEVEAALQRLAAHPLKWTLVDAPRPATS